MGGETEVAPEEALEDQGEIALVRVPMSQIVRLRDAVGAFIGGVADNEDTSALAKLAFALDDVIASQNQAED